MIGLINEVDTDLYEIDFDSSNAIIFYTYQILNIDHVLIYHKSIIQSLNRFAQLYKNLLLFASPGLASKILHGIRYTYLAIVSLQRLIENFGTLLLPDGILSNHPCPSVFCMKLGVNKAKKRHCRNFKKDLNPWMKED